MINAMLEHRMEATNSAVVVGVGVTLQSGELALDMMTAQPYSNSVNNGKLPLHYKGHGLPAGRPFSTQHLFWQVP